MPGPPAFVAGPVEDHLLDYLAGRAPCPSLDVYALRGVQVGPDGVVCADGRALTSWRLNQPADHVAGLEARIGKAAGNLHTIHGQVVLLSGPGWQVFGHWLVDMLPRLHLLSKRGLDISGTKFLVPQQAPAFTRVILSYFDIAPSQIVTWNEDTELAVPDDLIIATNLREQDRFHSEMAAACQTLLQRAPSSGGPAHPRRIFVTRSNSARSLVNRAEIEAAAVARGYTLIRPEQLSFAEQVQTFRQADRIAGEYGSGLHTAMFSPPGTRVLAVRGTSRYPGLIQSGLCEALGQPIGYVFGSSPFEALDHPFSVAIDDFHAGLDWLDG